MSNIDFSGWRSRVLRLPDSVIVCYFFQPMGCRNVSLHDENHNVFRLDAEGNVIWQVRRDDSIQPPSWWDILHEHARARGMDGAREPFMYFVLKYPDGRTNIDLSTGDPPDVAEWTPDCTIWLQGSVYQQYILDPETGVARNVTERRPRPW